MSDELSRYIRPKWKRHRLQTYAFISRLKNDKAFRKDWIKRRVQKEDIKNLGLGKQLLNDFIGQLELVPAVNIQGKPVIRISPKRFKCLSCQNLLDINLKHVSTCISLTVNEAEKSIIHGYGIVKVLCSVFGEEYRKMVTRYIIKKMHDEIGSHDGRG